MSFWPTIRRIAHHQLRRLQTRQTPVGMQWVLTVPFALQVISLVVLVGYLSYRNGQATVENLAHQLMESTESRIRDRLNDILALHQHIASVNQRAWLSNAITLNNPDAIKRHLWSQIAASPELMNTTIASAQGLHIGYFRLISPEGQQQLQALTGKTYPLGTVILLEALATSPSQRRYYRLDQAGRPIEKIYEAQIDVRTTPWYLASQQIRQQQWSPIYIYRVAPVLGLDALAPLYGGPNNTLQGVANCAIALSNLGAFLKQIHISPQGQTLIVERSGNLVASSTLESTYVAQGTDTKTRRNASNSQDPITRAVAQHLLKQYGHWQHLPDHLELRIPFEQTALFVKVSPYRDAYGLDWLLVTVVPESDFLGTVRANLYYSIALASLALVSSLILGAWLAQRLTRSLRVLTTSTQAIATGQLDTPLPSTRIVELNDLSRAFQDMAQTLQAAQTLRQHYARDLEQQVAQRTAALNEAQRIAHVGSWEFEIATGKSTWSAEHFRVMGLDPAVGEPSGDEIFNLIPPDDREPLQSVINIAIAHGTCYEVEHDVLWPDGTIRHVVSRGEAVRNEDGEVFKLVGTTADITERQKIELALRASEVKFSTIFHHSPQPAWISDLTDGRYLEINEQFAHFLGLPTAAVLGKTCFELGLWSKVNDLDYCRNQLQQFGYLHNHEVVLHTHRQEDRTVLMSARISSLGGQQCIIGVLSDITERKAISLALEQSEARLKLALEISGAIAWEHNLQTNRVSFISLAEQLGSATDEMLFQQALNLVHPHDRTRLKRTYQSAISTQTPLNIEHRTLSIKHSNQWRWLQSQGRVIVDATGRPTHLLGMSIDITDRKRTELSLQRNETRLRLALEISQAIAWEHDLSTDQIHFTQVVSAVGHPREMAYSEAMALVHPEDQAELERLNRMAINRCGSFRMEHRVQDPNGDNQWRWLLVQAQVLKDRDGLPTRIVGMSIDITERKSIELALKNSEARYRILTESSPVGIFRTDQSGRCIYANPKALEIIQQSFEESIGSGWLTHIHPDDRAWMQTLWQNFVARAANDPSAEYKTEKRYLYPNGSMRWALTHAVPEWSTTGELVGFVGSVIDITDRKRAEVEISREVLRRRAFFDASIDGIVILDRQGNILEANKSFRQMLGYSESEILRINLLDFDARWTKEELQKAIQAIPDRSGTIFETLHRRKDGSIFNVEVSSNPLDWDGQYVDFCICRDISDRKRIQQELQQAKEAAEVASQAKSAFLANMSHELRTPLNTILGFAELLVQDPSISPEHQADLNIIHHSGEHLLGLINDILELSKIESGKLQRQNQTIDLANLLKNLRSMFSQAAATKGLSLQFNFDADTPQFITSDAQKLEQVLINLLSNAIKFTPKGSITLRIRRDRTGSSAANPQEAYLVFSVSDTGVGMDPTELSQIFETFTQATAGRRSGEGTGLGLAISRKLVQFLGSELIVHSQVGVGSTFQFSILAPLAEPTIMSERPEYTVIGLVGDNGIDYRLLIVDDRAENRLLLRRILMPLGLSIREATNGTEAIEQWEQWQPHAILMDVQMPDFSGYVATQRIRQREQELPPRQARRRPATVIVALTAQVSDRDYQLAIDAGCNDYITKPFRAASLFNTLAQQLGWDYLYAESLPALPQTTDPADPLTVEDLAIMPDNWIAELDRNALLCADREVQVLIAQIPPSAQKLSRGLTQLNDNYAFAQIQELTQTYLARRPSP